MKKKFFFGLILLLLIIGILSIDIVASTGGIVNWETIKANDVARVSSDWDTPKELPFTSDGWQEGEYISPDGNTFFFQYINMDIFRFLYGKPGDVTITGPNRNDSKSCTFWINAQVPAHSCGTYVTFPWGSFPRADTFYSHKTANGGWTTPKPHPLTLAHPINGIVLTNNGTRAYFSMIFKDSNKSDIAYADNINGVWGQPVRVDVVSSSYMEDDPYVNPRDTEMFFWSDRPTSVGGEHIYHSIKVNGRWQKPEFMPPPINSDKDDMQTFLFRDNTLYFSSSRDDGKMKIYKTQRNGSSWGSPELVVSSNFAVGEPSIPDDGSRLYFEQIFTDGKGHFTADMMYADKK